MNFISSYIIPYILIGFGLFILSLQFRLLSKKNYINAFAKIVSSSKYESYTKQEGSVTYGVRLKYEYKINGEKYVSDNIFKNAKSYSTSDPSWANTFINDFPIGKDISIKVKSDEHSDSYIIEMAPRTWFLITLSLLPIIGGIIMLVFN